MKKLILALVALAVMALAPATALAAKGGTDRPYEAAYSGSSALYPTSETYSIVEFTGTGRSAPGGKGTLESTGTITWTSTLPPITFDYSASSTTTAANGDQLFSTEVGTGTFDPDGNFVIDVTSTITGGTGRFEGASGSSTGTITNVLVVPGLPFRYDTTISTSGTISY